MKKILMLVLVMLTAWCGLMAQQRVKVGELYYQASFPTGSFKDFVSKTSWVGFSALGRHYVTKSDRLSLGGSFSWFYFPDKQGRRTVELKDQGTYTGYTTNFTNIYGLMLIAQYDLKPGNSRVMPFVRAGIGGAYQNQRTDIGLYAFKEDGVQLMLNAEFGVRFSKDGQRGIVLAGNFHQLPAASDLISTTFFGVKLGISMKH
ncbi:outer membrane beta-barrel protein [Flavihumibacter petaseus]|nr:outer membrane beta-barrel protein [Flavihumibacter petaseus]